MKGAQVWIPGGLYKLGPKHQHYNSSGLREKVFLCTKRCVIRYKTLPDGVEPEYALICVDDGGIWAYDPDLNLYEEYL